MYPDLSKEIFSIIKIIRDNEPPLRRFTKDIGICQDESGLFIVAYIDDPSLIDKIPKYLRHIRVTCEQV